MRATITLAIATNNTPADVQFHVNAASSVLTNSTIILLTGSNTWSGASGVINSAKNIVIRSAPGYMAEIKHGYTVKKQAILYGVTSNNYSAIRDLRLWPGTGANQADGFIAVSATTVGDTKLRVTNLGFTNAVGRSLVLYGMASGVVDRCYVHNGSASDQAALAFTVFGSSATSWLSGPNFGNITNRYFFENNVVDFTHAQDGSLEGYRGARYCYRFNFDTNGIVGMHGVDSDSYTVSGFRGGHSWEIYGNTFVSPAIAADVPQFHQFRSGTGVGFSNTYWQAASDNINMAYVWDLYRATSNKVFASYGDGFANGSSRVDGNSAVALGSGTHDGVDNTTTLADSTKTWTINQFITDFSNRPMYVWNRTDGCKGLITANTATTVSVLNLSGGVQNDFDTGDTYVITWGYPALDQPGWSGPSTIGATFSTSTLSTAHEWENYWGYIGSPATNDFTFGVGGNYADVNPNPLQFVLNGREYTNNTVLAGYTMATYPHPLTATNTLSPASATLGRGAAQAFSSSGGIGGEYLFQLATNSSGGSLDSITGAYVSGFSPGVDVVRAWDRLGNYDDSEVTVADNPTPDSGGFSRRRKG